MDELNTVLEECRDESKQKEQDEVRTQMHTKRGVPNILDLLAKHLIIFINSYVHVYYLHEPQMCEQRRTFG